MARCGSGRKDRTLEETFTVTQRRETVRKRHTETAKHTNIEQQLVLRWLEPKALS